MGNAARYFSPVGTFHHKWYPQDLIVAPLTDGDYFFVDGDKTTDGNGKTWETAKATIQSAIDAAGAHDVIYIKSKSIADAATDPSSYAETLIIPNTHEGLSLIGVGTGRTQGGIPQIRKGSGSAALLSVRAPGCLIANLGFNGGSSTGGGILLDESAAAYVAFGTTIANCHFKNCRGSSATDSRTGGAIQWTANGGAWQTLISGNIFYKNVGDVVLKGTSGSIPQDIVIENNVFQGLAASVDCHLYLAGGSGIASVTVKDNYFADVLPALGSGSVVRYADLTGSTGIFANNYFAGSYTTSGFGAAKAAAKIPTTVGIAHNYSDAGLIVRES